MVHIIKNLILLIQEFPCALHIFLFIYQVCTPKIFSINGKEKCAEIFLCIYAEFFMCRNKSRGNGIILTQTWFLCFENYVNFTIRIILCFWDQFIIYDNHSKKFIQSPIIFMLKGCNFPKHFILCIPKNFN